LSFARRVQTDFPNLKLLMTSNRAPPHVFVDTQPFIPKPYDIAEVTDRIRAAVAAQVM
jgi:hypothetical protein